MTRFSPIVWTPELDAQICALRAGGMTWDGIAETMGMGTSSVHERGRRLAAKPDKREPAPEPPADRGRPPMPAGALWGLLTAGTPIDGTPYEPPTLPPGRTGYRSDGQDPRCHQEHA